MEAAEIESLRQKVLPVLLPWGARRVAVFGSVARGEETARSDIDILVDLRDVGERPVIGLKWFAIERELSAVLGRPVEMVTSRALSPYVRESVERDMAILYDEG